MTALADEDDRYLDGYSKGFVDAQHAANTGDCYVPVQLAWRHVRVGDVVASPDRRLWTVERIEPNRQRRVAVVARCGVQVMTSGLDDAGLDPDALVAVLELTGTASAERVARAGLGKMMIVKRTENSP